MVEKEAVSVTSGGTIIANAQTALDADEGNTAYKDVEALPALTAEVDNPSETAVVIYEGVFANFAGVLSGRMDVFTLTTDDAVHHFTSAPSLEEIVAGEFVVTDGEGNKIPSGTPLAGDELLFIAIADQSVLDWDEADEKIAGLPVVAQKASGPVNPGPGNGGGSGGCDAGFGAGAVVFFSALGFCLRRKR
jgi:hypothetical protein